jgi:type III pantothenate kinase
MNKTLSDNTGSSILLVDVGNTRLKWMCVNVGRDTPVHSELHLDCDIPSLLDQCWVDMDPPVQMVIANVAGEGIKDYINNWVKQHWGLAANFLSSPAEAFGVVNGYRQPGQLGIDRWLTLVAARHNYPEAVCIVDAGTALTIDVIDQQGFHKGGLILPGQTLMRESLSLRTKIPGITKTDTTPLLADNTSTAVLSACLQASVALIERVIRIWQQEHDQALRLILTGSDAVALEQLLETACEIQPDLVMQGLKLMATLEKDHQ